MNQTTKREMPISDKDLEKRLKYAYLEIGNVDRMKIDNPMLRGGFGKKEELVETMVKWMRDPDNLWFVCKYILNVDLLPFQVVILKQLWTKPFPMLIATRGGSKSFILTVYIALRALLDQGAKIVVVGAALRQSLVLYNYLQAIWQNAPILQDICGGMKFAPKRDLHMCSWKCGKSEVKFLPLGNGETIRGQRACVDGDTLIETSYGVMRISNAMDKMQLSDFSVYSTTAKSEMPHTFVKTKAIPAYKVTTERGNSLICSDIHRIMTDTGWKDAKDCIPGDKITISHTGLFATDSIIAAREILKSGVWIENIWNNPALSNKEYEYLQLLLGKIGIDAFITNTGLHLSSLEKWCLDTVLETGEVFDPVVTSTSVKSVERVEDRNLYDFYLPESNAFLGNGIVNHNTVVVADEFASIPPDVFETVVRGFAAVKSVGLVESVAEKFRQKTMEELGLVFEGKDQTTMELKGTATQTNLGCNQIVIAGTTTFTFNHFYKYYTYYRAIIESCGDPTYLRQNYPDMVLPPNIDSSQYCIMRIPYDLVPPGMMDESILSQGRATMNSVIFDQEYGCIFPSDSDGFYPATDIHRATCPVSTSEGPLTFGAEMYGDTSCWYVMGIDPASEQDHFAISIVKIVGQTRHMVYQWSTNRKRYLEMKERGKVPTDISDYTTFCIKHIRSLIRRFPIKLICCDMGGGGLSIKEGLTDPDKMEKGDLAIYDIDDENMRGNQGAYILHMIRFQDAEWRKEAHYGLKKDISDKRLLFPLFDTVQVASNDYMENSQEYETLDECYTEIEECKYETILIKHDITNTGTERWDVPKLKIAGADDIKKSLKKDRFTSLLLANWACRLIIMEEMNATNYTVIGRTLNTQLAAPKNTTLKYLGPNARKLRRPEGNTSIYRSFNS